LCYISRKKKLGLIGTACNIVVEPVYKSVSDVIGDYFYVKEFNEFDSFVLNVKYNKKFDYKITNINQSIELSDMPVFLYCTLIMPPIKMLMD
jgi:hypothetical protein